MSGQGWGRSGKCAGIPSRLDAIITTRPVDRRDSQTAKSVAEGSRLIHHVPAKVKSSFFFDSCTDLTPGETSTKIERWPR